MKQTGLLLAVMGMAVSTVQCQPHSSAPRQTVSPLITKCRSLRHYGKLKDAESCFNSALQSTDPLVRAEAYWGLGKFMESNDEFRTAYKKYTGSALVRVEWGNLYLEHYQPGDAAKLFEEGAEADPTYAPALLGMAHVTAEAFDKKAVEFAGAAIKQDPNYVEAHEFLAYLALEDDNKKLAEAEAQKALALSKEALDAMAVLASLDWLKTDFKNGVPNSPWIDSILKINPAYGEAYAAGAHFLVINYRYKECVALYRKALELNGGLSDARSQLGVNLMRLGFEDEAKQQLEQAYQAHYRDAETTNSLKLLDTLKNYQTSKTPLTEVMLNNKEATLLRPYVEEELQRAISTYERKYGIKLPGPVRLEVYPNHDDFVVRTLGLPGQGGLLGVTFGEVVAMDSPSARSPGEFSWADTLWHEMSHVYVLTETNNLVPRWFAEGEAVHEEGVISPLWGDRLTPSVITALKEKKLLPVLQLDRGFVRPQYPNQVIVSYYQAGKMCDYIAEKWGDSAILGMIHSYAARKTTAEVIQDNLHESPEAFDQDFAAWLDTKTGKIVQHFDEWKQGMKTAYSAEQLAKKDDEALRKSIALVDLNPDYVGNDSAYELTSNIYADQGKKTEAAAELEKYRDAGGKNVTTLKKLAKLEAEAAKPAEATTTLKDLLWVFPEDADVHKQLGHLMLDAGDAKDAVREYQAVLTLQPTDAAEAHYDLANALRAANRLNEAKDQVLLALETAPNFKPAQQLLLQLSQ